jgi:hypothetical protein
MEFIDLRAPPSPAAPDLAANYETFSECSRPRKEWADFHARKGERGNGEAFVMLADRLRWHESQRCIHEWEKTLEIEC